MNTSESTSQFESANVFRQLAAAFYDALLLFAILVFAFALTVPLTSRGIIAIDNPLMGVYFLGVCFLFFGWFWTHGGRTLGMRIWHVKVVCRDDSPISWLQALVRFVTALPGWGLLFYSSARLYLATTQQYELYLFFIISIGWVVADHWKNSWRDRVTHTRVILKKKSFTAN